MLSKPSLLLIVLAALSSPVGAANVDLASVEFANTTTDTDTATDTAQTGATEATSHYAYIEQSGLNKVASIVQSGLGNWASIVQTGLNADQAYIVQTGTNNRASIVQR